jgi:4-hydroxy-tetrahydrodipicolinate synthase
MELFGCGTALVTPFHGDENIDELALEQLVQWQIAEGVNWLVACGTTGETPTLNHAEWLRVLRIVAQTADGRVPVWAGCTENCTRRAEELTRMASQIPGITAILSANPFYNKPTQQGQFEHFLAVARSTHLPVVLYNVPHRTGANLEPSTVLRLIDAAPNIAGIKESSGNLVQIAELASRAPRSFQIYSGDDVMALGAIAVGGAGVISVASNQIPREISSMVQAALQNDWPTARQIHRKFFPLMQANFWETNPGPVKAVLAMMGRIQEVYRLPIVPVSPATRARLERLVGELGLLAEAPLPHGELHLF